MCVVDGMMGGLHIVLLRVVLYVQGVAVRERPECIDQSRFSASLSHALYTLSVRIHVYISTPTVKTVMSITGTDMS